ncbi:GNAT family N-acetyltransferase [Terribacillus sp. 179-K 1B1 HS]
MLSLAVHPDYRGQGIAAELLNELEKVCVISKAGNYFDMLGLFGSQRVL